LPPYVYHDSKLTLELWMESTLELWMAANNDRIKIDCVLMLMQRKRDGWKHCIASTGHWLPINCPTLIEAAILIAMGKLRNKE
jgi:hypothetical protein